MHINLNKNNYSEYKMCFFHLFEINLYTWKFTRVRYNYYVFFDVYRTGQTKFKRDLHYCDLSLETINCPRKQENTIYEYPIF